MQQLHGFRDSHDFSPRLSKPGSVLKTNLLLADTLSVSFADISTRQWTNWQINSSQSYSITGEDEP